MLFVFKLINTFNFPNTVLFVIQFSLKMCLSENE